MPAGRPHLDPGAFDGALIDLEATESWDERSSAERFAAAVAVPPDNGAPEASAEVLRQLAGAPVARIGRIPYASNAVFLLELEAPDGEAPDQPLRAIYKPERGERPLWDFPRRTLHLREVASYRVDAALRFGLIPPTVLRDGPLGPGSCQLFVRQVRELRTESLDRRLESQLRRLAALDALINNADRKRAHLLVAEPHRIQAIDNALTFLPYPRQRTVLVDLGGSRLPKAVTRVLTEFADDDARRSALRGALSLLLSPLEVEAFDHRLDELAAEPVYPRLDPWDGRPFEWF